MFFDYDYETAWVEPIDYESLHETQIEAEQQVDCFNDAYGWLCKIVEFDSWYYVVRTEDLV